MNICNLCHQWRHKILRKWDDIMGNEIILAGNLIEVIESSRKNALRKVNEELIRMYWLVGEYLSVESKNVSFGDKYIDAIAKEINLNYSRNSRGCKKSCVFGK